MSTDQARAGKTALAPPIATVHGHWLGLVRAAWVALFVLSLGSYAIALPSIYEVARTVCTGPDCAQWRLSPEGAAALRDAGLSVELYATTTLGLRVLSASVFFAVAVLIFRRRSDERLPLWLSFFLLLQAPGSDVGALKLAFPPLAFLGTLMEYLATALFIPLFYLFPDGRWAPRWSRALALLWVMMQIPYYFLPGSPLDADTWPPLLQGILFLGYLASAVFAQTYRYRRVSGPVERQQTKWVIVGLTVAILGSALLALIEAAPLPVLTRELAGTLVDPLFLVLPLSFGIAILRHRLWDIDVIINRALVYGALTATTVGLYALIVGGLGVLLQTRGSPLLSLLGAGTIAVLFAPLRDRLQRAVNRLMYGERDEPYSVLSRLGHRLEDTLAPEAVAPTVVETVREALRLPYAAIALKNGETYSIAAESGISVAHLTRVPLAYQGENIGELLLAPRAPGEELGPADLRLLDDLARQAGVAIHATRLGAQAMRLASDLQHSRERLVTAREEERRRLRRDLHDGLGPRLAGLTLRLETAHDRLAGDPVAEPLLADLTTRLRDAVVDIRRLVYSLRPPALDELGLVSAIREGALQYANDGRDGLSLTLDAPDELPALPAAVEVAAYRIAQEAITNVIRHAGARHCWVRIQLDQAGGALHLEVCDDGKGLDPGAHPGIGLSSMRERAEELGGTLTIDTPPTGGTCVRSHLPCRAPGGNSGPDVAGRGGR